MRGLKYPAAAATVAEMMPEISIAPKIGLFVPSCRSGGFVTAEFIKVILSPFGDNQTAGTSVAVPIPVERLIPKMDWPTVGTMLRTLAATVENGKSACIVPAPAMSYSIGVPLPFTTRSVPTSSPSPYRAEVMTLVTRSIASRESSSRKIVFPFKVSDAGPPAKSARVIWGIVLSFQLRAVNPVDVQRVRPRHRLEVERDWNRSLERGDIRCERPCANGVGQRSNQDRAVRAPVDGSVHVADEDGGRIRAAGHCDGQRPHSDRFGDRGDNRPVRCALDVGPASHSRYLRLRQWEDDKPHDGHDCSQSRRQKAAAAVHFLNQFLHFFPFSLFCVTPPSIAA